jgi:AcrR family transcriptional regulator
MSSAPNPERRSERARRAILDATLELCREVGYATTTIEAIAKRAGVGKQTIYRWWPSKAAVAFEAVNDYVGPGIDFPDTGDVLADLELQITAVARLFLAPEFEPAYTGLIAAAQSDPDAQAELREMLGVRVAACRARLERAVADGEVRDDVDLDEAIELVYAPLYYRLLLRTRPVDPARVPPMLELAFAGLRPSPA